jgi:hypothetical protein
MAVRTTSRRYEARSLYLADAGQDRVTLAELAEPFSSHICEHIRAADKQGTFGRSRFLDACRSFNAGDSDETSLIATTEKLGFQNVIDAFHVVQGDDVAVRFFHDERSTRSPGIRLDDALFDLQTGEQGSSLPHEAEARWRLVETAWALQLPRAALAVSYDADDGLLFAESPRRRKAVTRARDALNGYQKVRAGRISVRSITSSRTFSRGPASRSRSTGSGTSCSPAVPATAGTPSLRACPYSDICGGSTSATSFSSGVTTPSERR